MNRQTVHIGEYQYVCDFYDAFYDMYLNPHYESFVMLRNFDLYNGVIVDTDIYFIPTSCYDEIAESANNGAQITSIAFPNTNLKISQFSTDILKFNSNFSTVFPDINDEDTQLNDIYVLYGNDGHKLSKNPQIRCNKIRLYHSQFKNKIDMIVDVQNTINGINFHYLCKPIANEKTYTEELLTIDNQEYCEFIELYFINIIDLFRYENGIHNIYYEENLDQISDYDDASQGLKNSLKWIDENNNVTNKIPISSFIYPYKIVESVEDSTTVYKKHYITDVKFSLQDNYVSYPINIIFFPYDDIDETNSTYMLSEDYDTTMVSYVHEFKFSVKANIGFDNDGRISVIGRMQYPYKEIFSDVSYAYKYLNNISSIYYTNWEVNRYKEIYGDSLTDEEILFEINTNENVQNTIFDEETEDMLKTPLNFIGYRFEIASDIKFKNIIYFNNRKLNIDKLEDCAFNIIGIFDSWDQLPEHLVARIKFIDRILNKELESNPVVITKEYYKYVVNELDGVYEIKTLKSLNNNMKELNLSSDTAVNFINNINCTIVTNEIDTVSTAIKDSNLKIMYKPIFFKVNELQNIKLRRSIKQNVGINLYEYMTKVESFKLLLNDIEYIETGRNDIYVLFTINTQEFQESDQSGYYNILTQDDEYLSSGTWSVY